MACCSACEERKGLGCGSCSGLGDLVQQPPRRLTENELKAFLIYHGDEPAVESYLSTCDPPWGIIVNSFGEDMLVYRPTVVRYSGPNEYLECGDTIYVINVNGHPIVEQVQQAPYVSPDDTGFWNNFLSDLDKVLPSTGELGSLTAIISAALVLYAGWGLIRGE